MGIYVVNFSFTVRKKKFEKKRSKKKNALKKWLRTDYSKSIKNFRAREILMRMALSQGDISSPCKLLSFYKKKKYTVYTSVLRIQLYHNLKHQQKLNYFFKIVITSSSSN